MIDKIEKIDFDTPGALLVHIDRRAKPSPMEIEQLKQNLKGVFGPDKHIMIVNHGVRFEHATAEAIRRFADMVDPKGCDPFKFTEDQAKALKDVFALLALDDQTNGHPAECRAVDEALRDAVRGLQVAMPEWFPTEPEVDEQRREIFDQLRHGPRGRNMEYNKAAYRHLMRRKRDEGEMIFCGLDEAQGPDRTEFLIRKVHRTIVDDPVREDARKRVEGILAKSVELFIKGNPKAFKVDKFKSPLFPTIEVESTPGREIEIPKQLPPPNRARLPDLKDDDE